VKATNCALEASRPFCLKTERALCSYEHLIGGETPNKNP